IPAALPIGTRARHCWRRPRSRASRPGCCLPTRPTGCRSRCSWRAWWWRPWPHSCTCRITAERRGCRGAPGSRGDNGARVTGSIGAGMALARRLPSPGPEPRTRISHARLALPLLLVAGSDDDEEDPSAQTAASEATATAAASPPILSSRRAAPPVRAGDSAPAAMMSAARAPAGATSRAADVERGTGGPGPRRRVVEPDPPFVRTPVATFNQPWAMTFLPDGRALVTEKAGQLKLVDVRTGSIGTVSGVPAVAVGGQGGLGDVILHPNFAGNRRIYLSYIERSGSNYGAV